MQKIRYRLVYNRKKKLNRQGTALVQVEAKLDKRNIYMGTGIYLKPQHWDAATAQVVAHPQADDLNAMLFEEILRLQGIELSCWKRGIPPTLAMLREAAGNAAPPAVSFADFAKRAIRDSGRKESTKENLMSTVRVLERYRRGLAFADITPAFINAFAAWMKGQGKSVNTVGKHLRQLRTLFNEAESAGHVSGNDCPFRKIRIRTEKGKHKPLTTSELRRIERAAPPQERQRHVRDAFLFCCYTGLRYSDFRALCAANLVRVGRNTWLRVKMQKTGGEVRLPLGVLFGGKAEGIMARYPSVEAMAAIPPNGEANRILSAIGRDAGIRTRFTFHAARHTCATHLIHGGVPITTVQKVLGHSSVRTTQIYSEVLPDTVVRDLRRARM